MAEIFTALERDRQVVDVPDVGGEVGAFHYELYLVRPLTDSLEYLIGSTRYYPDTPRDVPEEREFHFAPYDEVKRIYLEREAAGELVWENEGWNLAQILREHEEWRAGR